MFPRKAFSLLELLMVLALLTLLASVIVPALGSWQARIEVDRANDALTHSINDAKLRAIREGLSWTIRWSASPPCLEVLPSIQPNKTLAKNQIVLPKSITFEFNSLDSNEVLEVLTVSPNGNLVPARIAILQDGKRVLSYECERLTGGIRRIR